jgi:hypothetical protein
MVEVKRITKHGENMIEAIITDKKGQVTTLYYTREEEKLLRETVDERKRKENTIPRGITGDSIIDDHGIIKKWCTGWRKWLPLNSETFYEDSSKKKKQLGQGWSCQSISWQKGKQIIDVLDGKRTTLSPSKSVSKVKKPVIKSAISEKTDDVWTSVTNKYDFSDANAEEVDAFMAAFMVKYKKK